MKTYFAKYLPVEGEIQVGDKLYYKDPDPIYIGNWSGNCKVYNFECDLIIIEVKGTTTSCKRKDLHKLSMCSRDIQVGDEYSFEMGKDDWRKGICHTEGESKRLKEQGIFKVVGEISPEATWVKEGDEFDEDEVQFKLIYEQDYEDDSIEIVSEEEWLKAKLKDKLKMFNFITLYEKIIEIKGPCGHFH